MMSQKREQKQSKVLKSRGSPLTLFAIFSFRNGFMMAKMPLNIRGSFTMWTAFIRMGKPSCGGRKGDVSTCGVFAKCLSPRPAYPREIFPISGPGVSLARLPRPLRQTRVGAKQEGEPPGKSLSWDPELRKGGVGQTNGSCSSGGKTNTLSLRGWVSRHHTRWTRAAQNMFSGSSGV